MNPKIRKKCLPGEEKSKILDHFFHLEIQPKIRDVLAKMRECGKDVKMRDFQHDCGMVDTYDISVKGPIYLTKHTEDPDMFPYSTEALRWLLTQHYINYADVSGTIQEDRF